MPDTTVRTDMTIHLPAADGSLLPFGITVHATPTTTLGLVAHPVVIDLFAVDKSRWTLTHTATGRYIPVFFPDEATVVRYAEALAPLTDWTALRPTGYSALDVARLGVELGGTPATHIAEMLARVAEREAAA